MGGGGGAQAGTMGGNKKRTRTTFSLAPRLRRNTAWRGPREEQEVRNRVADELSGQEGSCRGGAWPGTLAGWRGLVVHWLRVGGGCMGGWVPLGDLAGTKLDSHIRGAWLDATPGGVGQEGGELDGWHTAVGGAGRGGWGEETTG